MEIYGQIFDKTTISYINQTVSSNPNISRRALSQLVCQKMDWRSPNGQYQEMSCRKALQQLNNKGIIKLPEVKRDFSFTQKSQKHIKYPLAKLECNLSEIKDLKIELIKSRYSKDSKIWFDLIENYHYLGHGRLSGSQLRYIVKSKEHGYIGALGFSSATYKLQSRDSYIGWSERAHRENIQKVINNARFLIVPTVKVPNLASYILSQVLKRVGEDWYSRYGIFPVLVESYVDLSRYKGTSYRASNWEYVGLSSGRRDGKRKGIYLYPLRRDWQTILNQESPDFIGTGIVIKDSENWAEREFGSARIYDNRLKRRLYRLANDFYENPQANIPESCGDKSGTMAAYRFFQNKRITMKILLDSHTESTIERIKEHRIVLVPQDTTYLDYTTHIATEGLGPISTSQSNQIGLLLHDSIAFSEDGIPLGVIDAQVWARDMEDRGKKYRRKELAIDQKESMKWLHSYNRVKEIQRLCSGTKLVSIGDREADIYELFELALSEEDNPGLLVRAEKSRKRQVIPEQQHLWEYMGTLKPFERLTIHVPRNGNQKQRDALTEIRYAQVELLPPVNKKGKPSLKVWAVYLKEVNPPSFVKSPIEWMLLTTVEVNDFEEARRRVEWYSRRWGIEVYHKTLKSGCRIRDRQLRAVDRLESALAIDMVVAWRIYYMKMLGEKIPEASCSIFFKREEWEALYCFVHRTPRPPKKPPTIREAIHYLGQMGGYLGRKNDREPGTTVLWRGIVKLAGATEMYVIMRDSSTGS